MLALCVSIDVRNTFKTIHHQNTSFTAILCLRPTAKLFQARTHTENWHEKSKFVHCTESKLMVFRVASDFRFIAVVSRYCCDNETIYYV